MIATPGATASAARKIATREAWPSAVVIGRSSMGWGIGKVYRAFALRLSRRASTTREKRRDHGPPPQQLALAARALAAGRAGAEIRSEAVPARCQDVIGDR